MTARRFGLLVVMLGALPGCGPAPRPLGLPPPEYEEPRVAAWPPANAAAGTGAAGAAPGPAPSAAPVPEPPPPASSSVAPLPENTGGSGATLPAGTP